MMDQTQLAFLRSSIAAARRPAPRAAPIVLVQAFAGSLALTLRLLGDERVQALKASGATKRQIRKARTLTKPLASRMGTKGKYAESLVNVMFAGSPGNLVAIVASDPDPLVEDLAKGLASGPEQVAEAVLYLRLPREGAGAMVKRLKATRDLPLRPGAPALPRDAVRAARAVWLMGNTYKGFGGYFKGKHATSGPGGAPGECSLTERTIARRLRALGAGPFPIIWAGGDYRAGRPVVARLKKRYPDARVVAYLDPPYAGTTKFPHGNVTPPEVVADARRWQAQGADVYVSNPLPVAELVEDGWQAAELTRGAGFHGGAGVNFARARGQYLTYWAS